MNVNMMRYWSIRWIDDQKNTTTKKTFNELYQNHFSYLCDVVNQRERGRNRDYQDYAYVHDILST